MASSLKIVATPIGNLRDISLRAMDEIKRADVIFAEDTRHTLKLIQGLSITLKPECRLISCDAHKEEKRIEAVAERLLANENVLFVSDAGCPTISDPGSLLVQGILEQGLKVEIIPGPSAHSAALMGAGIDTTRFAYLGFLPKKKLTRKNLIVTSANLGLAVVIYESPFRINALLEELFMLLGNRRVVIARELTKMYETFHRGKLGEDLSPPFIEKGECVVIVESGKEQSMPKENTEEDLLDFIKTKLAQDESPKDVAKALAERFKIKKKAAYTMVLDLLKIS